MKPYFYQIAGAEKAIQILRKRGLVYLAWEERCGKSLTALLTFELSNATSLLILTKKKAISGWVDTLKAWEYQSLLDNNFCKKQKCVYVTNYHKADKVLADKYDIVILDESHSYLSAVPKPGKIWKTVRVVVWDKPIIYLSATPYSEHLGQIYHQLALSRWSPFREYKDFRKFFNEYGKPTPKWTPYGMKESYTVYDSERLLAEIDGIFSYKTRKELGFTQEPVDKAHYVELDEYTQELIKLCVDKEMLQYPTKDLEVPLDSPMKQMMAVYMLEGGAAKSTELKEYKTRPGEYKQVAVYHTLYNDEKIEYIKRKWGDTKDIAIMYHFIAEGLKLKEHFEHALILQGDAYAEGIDLSHITHLVIYSMSFSTSKHIQRRARQANKNRKLSIEVHYLLVKGGISEAVYNSVVLKHKTFTKNSYERWANAVGNN